MADGTESQVSDGSSADSPRGTHLHHLNADPGRVARIVAALRKAHAEQAASAAAAAAPAVSTTVSDVAAPPVSAEATPAVSTAKSPAVSRAASSTDTAEILDVPAPRRETSGVRPAKPPVPTLRWNPGSRYRASRLANRPALQEQPVPSAGHAPVPAPPVPAPPVPAPPVPVPPVPAPPASTVPVSTGSAPPALAGRLYRGPARRTGVFEREIWYPAARSSRVPRDVGEALVAAVERYRKGSISTSGLVRAIGRAHAA